MIKPCFYRFVFSCYNEMINDVSYVDVGKLDYFIYMKFEAKFNPVHNYQNKR